MISNAQIMNLHAGSAIPFHQVFALTVGSGKEVDGFAIFSSPRWARDGIGRVVGVEFSSVRKSRGRREHTHGYEMAMAVEMS